jgi:hypothetical protein
MFGAHKALLQKDLGTRVGLSSHTSPRLPSEDACSIEDLGYLARQDDRSTRPAAGEEAHEKNGVSGGKRWRVVFGALKI